MFTKDQLAEECLVEWDKDTQPLLRLGVKDLIVKSVNIRNVEVIEQLNKIIKEHPNDTGADVLVIFNKLKVLIRALNE